MLLRLAASIALVIAPLFVAIAAADETNDCAGADPAIAITLCTNIIGQAGVSDDKIADAFANRGNAHLLQNEIDRAIADLD